MKKLAPFLLTVLSLALLFLVGCDWLLRTSDFAPFILGSGAEWPDWHSQLNLVQQWLVTAALLLLPILTASSWLILGRDNSIRTITSSGDVIRLTPPAVERVVCREVKANVAEVIRVGAVARQGKKGPAVLVNVATSDKVPVPKVDADVRREVVKVLQQLLGVGDPSEVKIVVYDVQSASPRVIEKRRRAVEKAKPSATKDDHDTGDDDFEEVIVKPKALPAAPAPKPVDKSEEQAAEKKSEAPAKPIITGFPPKAFEAEAMAKPTDSPKPADAAASKDNPLPPKT